jgi:enoyl-CoA hydratase
VARGVLPTSGALFRAPRGLPVNVAREMILTGERIGVERLERLGLVNLVTEPGGAVDGALAMAAKIAANAPLSVQACVSAIGNLVGAGDASGWDETEAAIAGIADADDTQEGIRAFLEKRPPVWTGR